MRARGSAARVPRDLQPTLGEQIPVKSARNGHPGDRMRARGPAVGRRALADQR